MSHQILHGRIHVEYWVAVVPGDLLYLIFVHLVLDFDLLSVRDLTILLAERVVRTRVGLVYFGNNYIFNWLTLECFGTIIALSTEQANDLVFRQISVNAHQHLNFKRKVDPVRLIFETLIFFALNKLILLRRVVRLLQIVKSLSSHSGEMLALYPLRQLINLGKVLLEAILFLGESGLWTLRSLETFAGVSLRGKQRLDMPVGNRVVIFVHHLMLLNPWFIALFTRFGRDGFFASSRDNFAGVGLLLVCAQTGRLLLLLVNLHGLLLDSQFSASLPFWWRLLEDILEYVGMDFHRLLGRRHQETTLSSFFILHVPGLAATTNRPTYQRRNRRNQLAICLELGAGLLAGLSASLFGCLDLCWCGLLFDLLPWLALLLG